MRDCVTAASPVYRLHEAADNLEVVYPDAGHDFPLEVRRRAYAFIDRHLRPRVAFTRLIAHWAEYGDADYLKFVEDAKPEICQIGFYGGHFCSLAHTPQFKRLSGPFPGAGLTECGKWFEERNADIHQRGAKVVGHFNVAFLVGEPERQGGTARVLQVLQGPVGRKGARPTPGRQTRSTCWRRTPTARRWPRRTTASAT